MITLCNVISRLVTGPLRLALLASAFVFIPSIMAQPVTGQVIDKVLIEHQDRCFLVAVRFTTPMQYISHFPVESGDDLRIRIEPVITGVSDENALRGRESAHPHRADGLPLSDVLYEGDKPEGPFLTLQFEQPVTFLVRQGKDFRSILVQVHPSDADPSLSCPPLEPPHK